MTRYVPLKNYENIYEINKNGNIRNKSTKIILKHYIESSGYCRVNLYDTSGNVKKYYVHRLVALQFISKIKGKPEVDHIDCNRNNNKISNLRWADRSEQNYNKIKN
jgi:hypothetical protein